MMPVLDYAPTWCSCCYPASRSLLVRTRAVHKILHPPSDMRAAASDRTCILRCDERTLSAYSCAVQCSRQCGSPPFGVTWLGSTSSVLLCVLRWSRPAEVCQLSSHLRPALEIGRQGVNSRAPIGILLDQPASGHQRPVEVCQRLAQTVFCLCVTKGGIRFFMHVPAKLAGQQALSMRSRAST